MRTWWHRHWPKLLFIAWVAFIVAHLAGFLGNRRGPHLDPRTGDAPVPGIDFQPPRDP